MVWINIEGKHIEPLVTRAYRKAHLSMGKYEHEKWDRCYDKKSSNTKN